MGCRWMKRLDGRRVVHADPSDDAEELDGIGAAVPAFPRSRHVAAVAEASCKPDLASFAAKGAQHLSAHLAPVWLGQRRSVPDQISSSMERTLASSPSG